MYPKLQDSSKNDLEHVESIENMTTYNTLASHSTVYCWLVGHSYLVCSKNVRDTS